MNYTARNIGVIYQAKQSFVFISLTISVSQLFVIQTRPNALHDQETWSEDILSLKGYSTDPW